MSQLKAGAVLNYVVIILNIGVGLLYTPYMLRMLGQNEYGLYSLVASVISYLTILDLGLGNAVVRYTAKFRTEGKQQEQYEMFGMFLLLSLLPWETRGLLPCGAPPVSSSGSSVVSGLAFGSLVHFERLCMAWRNALVSCPARGCPISPAPFSEMVVSCPLYTLASFSFSSLRISL